MEPHETPQESFEMALDPQVVRALFEEAEQPTMASDPARTRMWAQSIMTATPARAVARTPMKQRRDFPRLLATVGLAAACGIALMFVLQSKLQENTHRAGMRQYVTKAGERLALTLPDGARVILAPQTTLQLPADYGVRTSTVTLTGRAHFEVTARADRPFAVQTGHVITRVLGTVFDVERYPTDPAVRIVVASGRVVSGGIRSIALSAGTVAHVTDSTARISHRGDVQDDMAWIQGRLVFRKTPAREIIAELNRVYDVDIQFADSSLANRLLTWTIPVATLPRTEMLQGLAMLLNAHLTQAGRSITIVPGRTGVSPIDLPHPSLSHTEHVYGR